MVDSSRPLDDEDLEIIELIKNKRTIVVINKIDLPSASDLDTIKKYFNDESIIYASVNTEQGIEDIKQKIEEFVYSGEVKSKDIYVTNVRHKDILYKAKESIEKGIETIESLLPLDIASVEYRDAYLKLGEITGDTVIEDIIDRIFNDFCIGK